MIKLKNWGKRQANDRSYGGSLLPVNQRRPEVDLRKPFNIFVVLVSQRLFLGLPSGRRPDRLHGLLAVT